MRLFEIFAVSISYVLVIITFPFSLCCCIKIVQEYERAVIFRLGRLRAGEARGPGVFFILPCIDEYIKMDLRTMLFDVPPQEALTRDAVTVMVDAVVYYRVVDPLSAVVKVENHTTDVKLPYQLQKAMAAEAEAGREARAKVIAAEGEMKASKALKEAADVINQSPGALQLRYLQTLNSIASERTTTVIFPVPVDIISHFVKLK